MELKLEQHEVEDILLAWAEQQFAGKFNSVNFETSYSSLRYVKLFREQEDAKLKEAA